MADRDAKRRPLTQRELLDRGSRRLAGDDPILHELIDAEIHHQHDRLALIASASIADPSVFAASGAVLSNVTAEGFPGARYHSGTEQLDAVEALAVERARNLFAAKYVNVQPHSGSAANFAVLMALMEPGETLLSLDLDAGGHLTHGAKASASGRLFNSVHYGLTTDGWIDYDAAAALAAAHRPSLIIAGASAYPRAVDFQRFRTIADDVGAYLLADISHIAGLVATGEHANPIDAAHVTTLSTYKQLGGPRGGLILSGTDASKPGQAGTAGLGRLLDRAVFPMTQGTLNPGAIAAKARALELAAKPEFKEVTGRIVDNARSLSSALTALGYSVLTRGTDNHIVMLDLRAPGYTGVVAERALQECGILVNRNRVPGDSKPALVTSGLRLGTNISAQRGMGAVEMSQCASLFHDVLQTLEPRGDTEYHLDKAVSARVRTAVSGLCERFPIRGYRG